jgi:hypothetical protein
VCWLCGVLSHKGCFEHVETFQPRAQQANAGRAYSDQAYGSASADMLRTQAGGDALLPLEGRGLLA